MSSGQKTLVENPNERALSADVNRMQNFIGRDRAQATRRLVNHPSSNFTDYYHPGLFPDMAALPVNPSFGTVHDVFGGLMVRCDLANDLLIDPGSVGMYNPTFPGLTADDSPYIVVDDPGVTTTGVLVFTPNAGPGPRIDMVECRAVSETLETTTRDIYDSVTQNFVPTVVPKVTKAKLEYRIRLGTPNGGFPAPDQEWCPLAYCVVQVGATGFTQSDFYDVRPLVGDRTGMFGRSAVAPNTGVRTTNVAGIFDRSIRPAGAQRVDGGFRGAFANYWFGGPLWRNTPSSIADFGVAGEALYFDFDAAANRCQGSAAPVNTNGRLNSIVAIFPWNLFRCVRYSQTTETSVYQGQVQMGVTRVPTGPSGILVLCTIATMSQNGVAVVTEQPSIFGTTTSQAFLGVVVGWALGTGSGYRPVQSNGKQHYLIWDTAPVPNPLTPSALPATTVEWNVTFSPTGSGPSLDLALNPGNVPNNVSKVFTSFSITVNFDSVAAASTWGLDGPYEEQDSVSGTAVSFLSARITYTPNATQLVTGRTDWVPLRARSEPGAGGGPSTTYRYSMTRQSGSNQISSISSQNGFIFGWEDY